MFLLLLYIKLIYIFLKNIGKARAGPRGVHLGGLRGPYWPLAHTGGAGGSAQGLTAKHRIATITQDIARFRIITMLLVL